MAYRKKSGSRSKKLFFAKVGVAKYFFTLPKSKRTSQDRINFFSF